MSLCIFKNILGKPGKGIHSLRIFNIAIIDVIMTIIGAFFISYIFNTSFTGTCIVLFILGIIFHRMFCVRTTIDKLLFPRV